MNRWCNLIGHKLPTGYNGQTPYGKAGKVTRDGLGREHWEVTQECERCGRDVPVIRFHMPVNVRLEAEDGTVLARRPRGSCTQHPLRPARAGAHRDGKPRLAMGAPAVAAGAKGL